MPGGVFNKSSRPKRPGAYFNWLAIQPSDVAPAIGSVVAVGFTHTWGPLEQAVLLSSLADFQSVFGGDPNDPTSGYIAVRQAFQGEGFQGAGGAGTVVGYRMGSDDAAKATKTIQNTAGSPANAITLSARYEGTDGNDLKVTTRDNADDVTKDDLLIYTGTTLLETYTFLATDIAALAAAINATSEWVTATSLVSGTSLAHVTASAFTGGDDGEVLVAQDYADAQDALETERFGIVVFEDLIDDTILDSTVAWVQGLNTAGKRMFLVVGGDTDESVADAITRSAGIDDPDVLNVGGGHVTDSGIKDVNGDPVALSTAQLAPRIAGVLAHRGERESLTFAHMVGLSLYNAATEAEILRAFDSGVIVLSRDSNQTAPVRIEKSLTTYTDTTDPDRPYKVFRDPKALATMHAIETELTEWAEATIIGSPVDAETRAAVLGKIGEIMDRRVNDRIIQTGWTAIIDPIPPPSDDDDFVAFEITAKYGRSTEQVYFTGRLG
jgi:Phage tail sheath protein beta-sandwich domain